MSTGIKIIIALIVIIFVPFPIWLPLLIGFLLLKAFANGLENFLNGIAWAVGRIKDRFKDGI